MRKTNTKKQSKPDTDHGNVVNTMLSVAHECQSLSGILQTIGENFAEETEDIKKIISPQYEDESKQQERIWNKLKEALPEDEKHQLLSEMDTLHSCEVGTGERAFFALGIVFGMRFAGASEDSVRKVCGALEIPD